MVAWSWTFCLESPALFEKLDCALKNENGIIKYAHILYIKEESRDFKMHAQFHKVFSLFIMSAVEFPVLNLPASRQGFRFDSVGRLFVRQRWWEWYWFLCQTLECRLFLNNSKVCLHFQKPKNRLILFTCRSLGGASAHFRFRAVNPLLLVGPILDFRFIVVVLVVVCHCNRKEEK